MFLQKVHVENPCPKNRQKLGCQRFAKQIVSKSRFLLSRFSPLLFLLLRFWAFFGEGSLNKHHKTNITKVNLTLVFIWPLTHPPRGSPIFREGTRYAAGAGDIILFVVCSKKLYEPLHEPMTSMPLQFCYAL
jgi:hypothetical protein